jgi:hypothetical protein
MSDPLRFVKNSHLHSLKAVGHHLMHSAKDKGTSTAKPLAFIGIVTVALGGKMLWEAWKQTEAGRGEGRHR